MQPRKWVYPLAALLLASAVFMAGCGANPSAQAEQAPPPSDTLSDPPPMPPSEPGPVQPTPVPAPAAQPQLAGARNTLLAADFEGTANLSAWQVVDTTDLLQNPSVWAIEGGRLAQVSDGEGIPSLYGTALVTGQADWSNYTVSAAAYATGNDEIGVVARASDQGFYVFRLLPNAVGGETRILSRYDAASGFLEDIAAVAGAGFEEGKWYVLSVSVQGNQIRAFIDGAQVLEATDSNLSQGQAGVYGYAQGNLQFDNFAVQALPNSQ